VYVQNINKCLGSSTRAGFESARWLAKLQDSFMNGEFGAKGFRDVVEQHVPLRMTSVYARAKVYNVLVGLHKLPVELLERCEITNLVSITQARAHKRPRSEVLGLVKKAATGEFDCHTIRALSQGRETGAVSITALLDGKRAAVVMKVLKHYGVYRAGQRTVGVADALYAVCVNHKLVGRPINRRVDDDADERLLKLAA